MTSRWRESMAAVPRQMFIPNTIWRETASGLLPLSRDDDPDRWLELASGDNSVITQVDDGRPVGPGLAGKLATSSASMPKLVAGMLDHLDAHEGQRVLEIGTGTGWNAALLAHRLGAEHITTIEVDPDVAAHARKALSDAGYGGATTVVGDGALGHPAGAPYDRLIATVACRQMPYTWVAQTRPGGRIVAPSWALDYYGMLLALTVAEDGSAAGHFVDDVSFMMLRDQRVHRRYQVFRYIDEEHAHATVTETDIHPAEVASGGYARGAVIAIGMRVADCRMGYFPKQDPESNDGVLWLVDHDSGSWARLYYDHGSDGPYPVYQFGPRKLWDEVEIAHHWWVEHGRPDADRWRFTVTSQGQRIELVGP